MKKLTAALTILSLTATGAWGGPTNLLIGKWTLDPTVATNATPYCLAPLEFTASTFTQRNTQGKISTIPVSYIPAQTKTFPTTVYLVMDGDHLTYVFKSADRMVLDTFLQCTYVRG